MTINKKYMPDPKEWSCTDDRPDNNGYHGKVFDEREETESEPDETDDWENVSTEQEID